VTRYGLVVLVACGGAAPVVATDTAPCPIHSRWDGQLCVREAVGAPEKPSAHPSETRPTSLAAARAAFERGKDLYEGGDLNGALAAFEQAYLLQPSAGALLYNIAHVLEQLGRIADAIDYLQRYQASLPKERASEVQPRLDALRQLPTHP
jgi:tetratricopeptide (TPR) repeat protein